MIPELTAVVLAAGNSTRLRPLTVDRPKPMIELEGKPIMEYVLRSLKRGGIDDVTITTHYQATSISKYFGNGDQIGMKLSYAYEPELMDTAGSLALLKNRLARRVFICSGHYVLPDLDIPVLLNFHDQKQADGTIVFKELELPQNPGFFGQGQLDGDGRLVRFEEKPTREVSRLVHTTYQVYDRAVLESIPIGRVLSIPEYLIPRMLAAQDRLYGYVTLSRMLNISNFDRYIDAKLKAAKGYLDGI